MSQVRYTVTLDDPNSHLFHVKMEVRGAPGPSTDFVLPAWTPGSYKLRDFAKNVQDFSAGRHAWRKVDKSRWRVAAGGDVTVEYDVWAFELSVQSSHVDAEHAFVNGAGVFMYVDGHKDAPVSVEIRAPKGWRVATGLDLPAWAQWLTFPVLAIVALRVFRRPLRPAQPPFSLRG